MSQKSTEAYLAEIAKQKRGHPVQWFGDVVQGLANAVGLSQFHSRGIASFVTGETIMQHFQEWAWEQKVGFSPAGGTAAATSSQPYSLPWSGILTAVAEGYDEDDYNAFTPQVRRVLDEHSLLRDLSTGEQRWTLSDLRDHIEDVEKGDVVLVQTLALYWITWNADGGGLEDVARLCPTAHRGDWAVYDPEETFAYHAGLRLKETQADDARDLNLIEAFERFKI